jgi:hypothetical protein
MIDQHARLSLGDREQLISPQNPDGYTPGFLTRRVQCCAAGAKSPSVVNSEKSWRMHS